ncbi:hypothetical protein MJG53_006649 [Ovis ammon polii x Ovis aries]|uniref:Uncharacterized protein n=1 Tax=Ovis ammon polii x Ovis aries TaxID=2918886 RepID=A0ACB9V6M4_9CETA|nr:hypothetical protein MJG53_006649 [Ovis ammon polii x Ovis aries]
MFKISQEDRWRADARSRAGTLKVGSNPQHQQTPNGLASQASFVTHKYISFVSSLFCFKSPITLTMSYLITNSNELDFRLLRDLPSPNLSSEMQKWYPFIWQSSCSFDTKQMAGQRFMKNVVSKSDNAEVTGTKIDSSKRQKPKAIQRGNQIPLKADEWSIQRGDWTFTGPSLPSGIGRLKSESTRFPCYAEEVRLILEPVGLIVMNLEFNKIAPVMHGVPESSHCWSELEMRFSTYDSTCQLAQEIAEKIQQRNQYERNGENTTKLTVTIRALLQKLKEKIALLKDLLLRAVATHQITQLEGDRRQNLLDDLVTRERLLLASFKNEGAEPDLIRSSLMTGGAKRGAPNPWLLEEPEETRGLGFDEIRQQQQKIIQEQDAGLDALSSIISRQKQMGQEIGNELDEQNEIIDDLANLVENTDEKLRTETRRVNLVDRKSTSCGMIMVILLLLVAIVVVAVWPTN